jgi:O-Antigen ligase
MFRSVTIPQATRISWSEYGLVLAGALAVACFILVPRSGFPVLIGVGTLGVLAIGREVFRGRIDPIVVWWAALYPFSYFVSLPREHPIVTPQRLIVFTAFAGLVFARPSTFVAMPKGFRRAGLACLAFVAVAGFTLRQSPDILGSARVLVDAFLLPVLLGWYVLVQFDVRRRLSALHAAVCISSIISAAIAAAEIATGRNLMPFAGTTMAYAGGIARPNGPFGSNDALALAGAVSLFFLLFLGKALGPDVSLGRKLLHYAGLGGSIGMALMPMFRSIGLALLLVLVFDAIRERKTARRAWRVALISAFVGSILLVRAFAPNIFEDRSSSDNVYARVAEYEQSLRVFTDHPFLGVGFSNFNNFVAGNARYLETYKGVYSVDWPHSNLAAVLAETGSLGFGFFAIAQFLLFRTMWPLRRASAYGALAWRYFAYMFMAYWITGLTETTGYDGFVNLWFVFAITVFYKFVLTDPEPMQPAEVHIPESALSRVA